MGAIYCVAQEYQYADMLILRLKGRKLRVAHPSCWFRVHHSVKIGTVSNKRVESVKKSGRDCFWEPNSDRVHGGRSREFLDGIWGDYRA
jgi:hypothetical protein